MVAALPIISAVAGGIGAISSISGMFGSKPKSPTPVTPPPPPTVNQAAQQADDQQAVNARKGALANMLTPSGTYAQQTGGNTSLKSVLGG